MFPLFSSQFGAFPYFISNFVPSKLIRFIITSPFSESVNLKITSVLMGIVKLPAKQDVTNHLNSAFG